MAMMTMKLTKTIERLRKEFPQLCVRGLQIKFVRTLKCPRCGVQHMDPGPSQDPWRLTCRECGQSFRPKKPPKELTW